MRHLRVLGLLLGALLVVSGCAEAPRSEPLPQTSKYASETTDTRPFGKEVASVDAAQSEVGFDLLVPTDTLGSNLENVAIRDKSGNSELSKEQRGVELTWGDLTIAEAPFATADEAHAFVDSIADQPTADAYVKRVKVRGQEGLAWEKGTAEDKSESGDVNLIELPSSTVIWSEGRVVYRVASNKASWARLLAVANSMK